MYLLTRSALIEQDGEPEFYIRQEDIDKLAFEESFRVKVLAHLGLETILIASTNNDDSVATIDLSLWMEGLDHGYHSKL